MPQPAGFPAEAAGARSSCTRQLKAVRFTSDPHSDCGIGLMCARLRLIALLAASGWLCVVGMRVSTAGDVEAVNGTDVRLRCTFQSSNPIRLSSLTVSWSFRPFSPGQEETVFYYHEVPFPPKEGRFLKKVQWAGDLHSRDASIVLRKVPFSYNGTFSCQVKNPPDVHGNVGQVRLRVVTTASFSEIVILCVAIGGAILLIVLILMIFTSVRHCHKKKNPEQNCMIRQERKDLMVW